MSAELVRTAAAALGVVANERAARTKHVIEVPSRAC